MDVDKDARELVAQIPQVELGNRLVGVAKHAPVEGNILPRKKPHANKVGGICLRASRLEQSTVPLTLCCLPLPGFAQVYSRKVWKKETSLFAEWNADVKHVAVESFEVDFKQSKLPNLIKDDEEELAIRKYIRPLYQTVTAIFKRYGFRCCSAPDSVLIL